MNVIKLAGAAALSLALFGTANAATNLVNDPYFTGSVVPSNNLKEYSGSGTIFGGWTVVGTPTASYNVSHPPSVDVYSGVYTPGHSNWVAPGAGQNTVELDGAYPGGIKQTVTGLTTAGNYTLTFDLASNPTRNLGTYGAASVGVSVGSNSTVVPFTGTSTRANMGYQLVTYNFHYDGLGDNVLSFLSQDSRGSSGAVIGNIDLFAAAAPEPSAWALMLIGFGGLGAALRMNRRRAFAAA